MRKYSLFFAAIAASATLVLSCSKEIDAPGEETTPTEKDKEETPENKDENTGSPNYDGLFSLTLTTPETKTEFGDKVGESYPKIWKATDKINVNGEESNELRDEDIKDDGASATFYFESQPKGDTYKVVYPSIAYAGEGLLSIPAVQEVDGSGKFDPAADIMIGTGAPNETISMTNSIAWLKIKLTKGDYGNFGVSSIQVSGKDGQKLNGTFTIDGDNNIVDGEGDVADDEKTITLNVAGVSSLNETAKEFLIAVAPKDIEGGISVKVTDSKGYTMTKTSSSKLTKGQILALPEIKFQEYYPIYSAADLVRFAKKYNAGELDHPYALLKNIIDFSEAPTSFDATGGIGNKDGDVTNYFNGVFDGGNKTISGLAATVPLFAYIGSGGTVKNITLSSTCSYTVETSSGSNHGTLVGRNKGTVKDCTSNANVVINNIQDLGTASQYYGGLVGTNAGGTIDGCIVAGDITCSQTGQTIEIPGQDNAVSIGGIVGFTESDGGSINNCKFQGNITVSDDTTYGGITARATEGSAPGLYFYVGGILGRAEKGIVTGCYAGIDGTPKAIDVRGTFVPAVGGIIGWNVNSDSSEIRGNYNYMSLSFASSGARTQTTPCRIGGIAARSVVKIKDCHNYGTVSSTCNSTTLYLGGIAGDGCDIEECTNYASGAITRNNANETGAQANRYMRMGGIMGAPSAASTISSCKNYASVTSNELGTSTATTIEIGGVVGGGNGRELTINGCSNEGEVKLENDNPSAVAVAYNALGGIVGYVSTAGTTVESCDNSGKIWCNNNTRGSYGPISIGGTIGRAAAATVVTDCTNGGEILCQNPGAAISAYVDLGGIVGYAETTITISGTTADATQNSGTVTVVQASSDVLYARNTQGGILGYGKGSNTSITNCKNTNQIYCNLTGALANNRPSYTGGIVGILANLTYTDYVATTLGALTGVEIGNCENTGKVNSNNYNNRGGNKVAPFAGGIVGLVCGTNKSLASIHDCTVGNQSVYMYRGASGGGIIGYANYCNIEDCTSSADMSGMNASVSGVGGIVGRMFDSEMTRCTFSGKIARAKNIGGLVYTLSEQQSGSSISNCNVNGATLTTGSADGHTEAAVLISITDNKTNTITGCGVKGTLNSAAITLDSNMITTDGGATVTETYLLL